MRLKFHCQHEYPKGLDLNIEFQTHALVTSIFGPSGSGKTTILEMIAGLRKPQYAFIQLGDSVYVDTERHFHLPAEKRCIGMVFQDHLLFPHLTVDKNLRYGLKRRQKQGNAIDFQRVVEVLDLKPLLNRYPKTLSGGERQRVALGRALLSGPQMLLMDEPLAALDETLKNRILNYVERVVQEWHIPTILVSHSQTEVRRLSDWVIVIDKGRKIAEGKAEKALAHPDTLRWKNITAPVNLLQIEELRPTDGVWLGRVGNQFLRLPELPLSFSQPIFVQIAPDSVILSRKDVTDISARNHLTGKVQKIVDLPEGSFIAIDVGQTLWVEITHEALVELKIETGMEITCLIKTHSMRLID